MGVLVAGVNLDWPDPLAVRGQLRHLALKTIALQAFDEAALAGYLPKMPLLSRRGSSATPMALLSRR
jgi:hypothetical protein